MCARALEQHIVNFYCSGIGPDELERMFFKPAASPQDAIIKALKQKGPDARIIVLPQAVSCVPGVLEPE